MEPASINVLTHSFCHTTYILGQRMNISVRQSVDVPGTQVACWCVALGHTPIF